MQIYWDITKSCNLKCVYCYNRGYYNNGNEADLNHNKVMDIFDQFKANGVDYIHFLGGEPFCRNDFIEILEECDRKDLSYGIATNGTLLNKTIINCLCNLKNLKQIVFSIDSCRSRIGDTLRGNGSWQRATTNLIDLLHRKNKHKLAFKLGIEAVITKINLFTVEETIGWAVSLGIDIVRFDVIKLPIIATSNFKDDLLLGFPDIFEIGRIIALNAKQFNRLQVKIDWGLPLYRSYLNNIADNKLFKDVGKRCPAVIDSVWVGNDGRVQPCFYVNNFKNFEVDFIEDLYLERKDQFLKTQPFNEILYSDYFRQLYRFLHTVSAKRAFSPCSDCIFLDRCDICPLDIMKFGQVSARQCQEFIKWRSIHE